MYSVLKDIFNGKELPYDNLVPNDPEYHALRRRVNKAHEYLKEKLSADDIIFLEKIQEEEARLSNMESIEAFSIGFRLATKIMIEIYHDKNEVPDILKLLGINNSDK